MRLPLMFALLVFYIGSWPCDGGPDDHQIARSGDTSLRFVIGKKTIITTFHTFVVKKSDPWFPSNLEGYDDLSFVQNVEITVNGEALWVPRSAYLDLFNARAGAVRFENGSFVLSIAGADGADAYQVRIYFDSKKVTRRAVFGLEGSPQKPSEETRYAPPLVID